MFSYPESRVRAVDWRDSVCLLLDQTLIPSRETYLHCTGHEQIVDAIRRLAVRGAPAIGIAGAYGAVLALRQALSVEGDETARRAYLTDALGALRSARPTAVNLEWAVRRMEPVVEAGLARKEAESALEEARSIHREDVACNRRIAELGAGLLPERTNVITYCNTGDLATGGIGTAFGVVHAGVINGKIERVYPCETRPVLQGLRLTAWELEKNGLPFTVICDNMAAQVMRDRNIGAVFVGADRIARNGDTANKIGTYGLAVLARHHGVPFYVVAPSSTFDPSLSSGREIPIEERATEEIFSVLGANRPATAWEAYNPAFDVTPAELISGIVCERGVLRPPFEAGIGNGV